MLAFMIDNSSVDSFLRWVKFDDLFPHIHHTAGKFIIAVGITCRGLHAKSNGPA